jgi:LL-diaminopimelate aminotransferase
MPLIPEKGFVPDLDAVRENIKLMYLNYPNNPTGATVELGFLKKAAEFAESSGIMLCYDNAYSELAFDDYLAPSILQATQNAVEFCSMSKTFNMTGYRLGFAVGHPDIIAGLKKLKAQVDSGPPIFIQKAAVVGLDSYTSSSPPEEVKENIKVYERRRDVMVPALRSMGFGIGKPKATFYLWFKVEGGSIDFADRMLDAGVVVTPGIGFGSHGEGYVRIALTQKEERLKEAADRMEKVLKKGQG